MTGIVTDYATLQASVADWLARSDLSSFIPSFVQNWEERFYRQPQNWAEWMEKTLNLTVASSVCALPSDYLGVAIAYVSGQRLPPLKRLSREQLYERYPRTNSSGIPQYISRSQTNLIFGPIPSDGTVIVGDYYAKPALLRASTTNWLTTNAPDLLLYGALLEASPFLKDDARLPLWQSMYDTALNAYREMWQDENFSGTAPFTVAV